MAVRPNDKEPMPHSIRLLSLTSLAMTVLVVTVNGQRDLVARETPVLSRTTQEVVAPDTAIELRILFPDGIPETSAQILFVFIQNGKKFTTRATGGTGEQDTGFQTFNVTVPEGLASGLCQKKVNMKILIVPLPLEIFPNRLMPVAPGQWLDIGVEDVPLYNQPKQVEVEFAQNGHTEVIDLQLDPNDELHVQVPQTLLPGEAVVRTRTRRDGRISEWSQAVGLELLDHPASPVVDSVQRIRKKGDQSDPLVYLEGDRSPVLIVEPGNRIALRGHFAVESTSSLRINLVKGERRVVIRPSDTDRPYTSYFEVELPRNLRPGEWQVHVLEEAHNTSARLFTLRVR